jgi:hypothetical protein
VGREKINFAGAVQEKFCNFVVSWLKLARGLQSKALNIFGAHIPIGAVTQGVSCIRRSKQPPRMPAPPCIRHVPRARPMCLRLPLLCLYCPAVRPLLSPTNVALARLRLSAIINLKGGLNLIVLSNYVVNEVLWHVMHDHAEKKS